MKKYTRFNGGNADFVEVTQLVKIFGYGVPTEEFKVAVRIHSVDTIAARKQQPVRLLSILSLRIGSSLP